MGTNPSDTWLDFVLRSVIPGLIGTILIGLGALGVGWLPLDTAIVDNSVVDALAQPRWARWSRKTAVGVRCSRGCCSDDVITGRDRDIKRLWLALGRGPHRFIVTPPLFSQRRLPYFAQGEADGRGY